MPIQCVQRKSCSLKKEDCSTGLDPQTNVMKEANSYSIKIHQKNPLGYGPFKFCFRCRVKSTRYNSIFVFKSNLITIEQLPINCNDFITHKTFTNIAPIVYKSSVSYYVKSDITPNSFWIREEQKNCVIGKCKIMEVGCAKEFVQTYIKLDTDSRIKTLKNYLNGYAISFCY